MKRNLRYAAQVLCHKFSVWLGEFQDLTLRRVEEQREREAELDIPEMSSVLPSHNLEINYWNKMETQLSVALGS